MTRMGTTLALLLTRAFVLGLGAVSLLACSSDDDSGGTGSSDAMTTVGSGSGTRAFE
ncbi:MAG TPA: hypothetical protein VFU02_04540 [Polyangiaceae bacterium]|nr:hypothetical protein [Polyangiaceae bacterium]